ncbi:hypothetical protein [Novosphingobium rosa]|jgi:hypothetical protein|uniref:hypothetical protein n=1 Tax=Novosphingobium rosa TaxID=76978 RepID=UPI000A4449F7|nr:hypothetical protein [Novosphingobium rosa]
MRGQISVSLRARLLVLLAAAINLSACSPPEDKHESYAVHDRASTPSLIGEHFYTCNDRSVIEVDFLDDGLTLNLTKVPHGKPVRLVSPATGRPYSGGHLTVSLSNGGMLTVKGPRGLSSQCNRIRRDKHTDAIERDAQISVTSVGTQSTGEHDGT